MNTKCPRFYTMSNRPSTQWLSDGSTFDIRSVHFCALGLPLKRWGWWCQLPVSQSRSIQYASEEMDQRQHPENGDTFPLLTLLLILLLWTLLHSGDFAFVKSCHSSIEKCAAINFTMFKNSSPGGKQNGQKHQRERWRRRGYTRLHGQTGLFWLFC